MLKRKDRRISFIGISDIMVEAKIILIPLYFVYDIICYPMHFQQKIRAPSVQERAPFAEVYACFILPAGAIPRL